LLTFYDRKSGPVSAQVAEIGFAPLETDGVGMLADEPIGGGQIVIRNRRPEMMSSVKIHIHERDEHAFERIADVADHSLLVGGAVTFRMRVFGKGAEIIAKKHEEINRQEPKHGICPPANQPSEPARQSGKPTSEHQKIPK